MNWDSLFGWLSKGLEVAKMLRGSPAPEPKEENAPADVVRQRVAAGAAANHASHIAGHEKDGKQS